MTNDRREIELALEKDQGDALSQRDFKDLGFYIEARTQWQELARTIKDTFPVEPKFKKTFDAIVFKICNPANYGTYKKTIGEIKNIFEASKKKGGARYFLASFRKPVDN